MIEIDCSDGLNLSPEEREAILKANKEMQENYPEIRGEAKNLISLLLEGGFEINNRQH
jgi:hypothetical protein